MKQRRDNPAVHSSHELKYVLERVGDGLHARRRRRQALRIGGAGATAVLLTVGAMYFFRVSQPGALATMAPLRHADGTEISEKEQFVVGSPVELSDGSSMQLDHGAELVLGKNVPQEFRTELVRGRVTYDVNPSGGRRRWTVQAGTVQVQVLGTRFSVDRSDDWVRVRVERGRVRVAGPQVPGQQRDLGAGQTLEVPLGATHAVGEPASPSPTTEDGATSDETSPTDGREETEAVAHRASEPEVLRRADRLRRQGKHQRAANLLRRALSESRPRSESAVLALTLGRVQLHSLGQPQAAARSFDRAIRDGLAPGLREQALARSVQAWASAGHHSRALGLAQRYMRDYPTGPNREFVLRWLERPRNP